MLGAVELFSECSKKELGQILAVAKEIDFEAGENICVQGEPSGRFYLILEGSVAVKRNGRTRATLAVGDYFGEIALIDGQPRTATCTAPCEAHPSGSVHSAGPQYAVTSDASALTNSANAAAPAGTTPVPPA